MLCAILRDEPQTWQHVDAPAAQRLFDTARHHGVHLLIADRLAKQGTLDACPLAFQERLRSAIRNQVAMDEVARDELRRVLAALAGVQVHPILFKGAALAYSHYSDPSLRPRADADLLIDDALIASASKVLETLGYARAPFTAGELVMYQVPYVKTDPKGVQYALDVHWKVSNPQVFADVLTSAELEAQSVAIPALGNTIRGAGPVHALILACVHRAAHHSDEERLIWLYDIHLIAERLDTAEQALCIELVRAKQLTAVCADALAAAARSFHGAVTADIAARLAQGGSSIKEPSAIYAGGGMRKIDILRSDLAALSWSKRLKLLKEHLLPPPEYMRQVYGVSSRGLLPFYYAWRFARGATAWWRGVKPNDASNRKA
jgi:hypothetical protein